MSEVSMGQIAFEAAAQYIATNVPEIENEWGDLPPAYREAWEAGAQAVLAERERSQTEANASGSAFNDRAAGLHHPLGEER